MKNTPDNSPKNKIEQTLDKVRPFIRSHGGDITVAKVDGTTATLVISGRCVGCALVDLTYDRMLRSLINESVPEITEVIFKHGKKI